MPSFKILDKNRFPLCPSTKIETVTSPFYKWEHRATIQSNYRKFFVFVNIEETTAYIEEYKDGGLVTVSDDILFEELLEFVLENELLLVLPPIPKPIFERSVR